MLKGGFAPMHSTPPLFLLSYKCLLAEAPPLQGSRPQHLRLVNVQELGGSELGW